MKWRQRDDFHWVYLAHFKRLNDEPGDCISPQRRDTFEAAVADASAHIRAQKVAA